jgi:hypothetical protein
MAEEESQHPGKALNRRVPPWPVQRPEYLPHRPVEFVDEVPIVPNRLFPWNAGLGANGRVDGGVSEVQEDGPLWFCSSHATAFWVSTSVIRS